MNKFLAAASAVALSVATQGSAEVLQFEFTHDGWSDGGIFSGSFTAEDLNFDGVITFGSAANEISEIISFDASYLSNSIETSFGIDSIVGFEEPNFEVNRIIDDTERTTDSNDEPPFGIDLDLPTPGGLTFVLDGDGRLGNDFIPVPEGLTLRNDLFSLSVAFPSRSLCDVPGGDFPCAVIESNFLNVESEEILIGPSAINFDSIPITGDIEDDNGNFENLPIFPVTVNENGGFEFPLGEIENLPGRLIFFDPEIAVGYTYEVTGNEFLAVQAPTTATVNDPDGYTVVVDGVEYELVPGPDGLIVFSELGLTGVTKFTIKGINPLLELDPTDTQAFVTGLIFADNTGSDPFFTQTPIVVNTDPSVVPLPAGGVLLMTGLAGMAYMRRRRAAS